MFDILCFYKDFFFEIGQCVMIDISSVVIGDVCLVDDVGIWLFVVICGDVNYVVIGVCMNIQDGSVFYVIYKFLFNLYGNLLIIGENVIVGYKVMLYGCIIGNCVLVGMGFIVLDGVIIEDDVMIGVGSLVLQYKWLESGYLYFGSLVKQICFLSDVERLGLQYFVNNYVKWKDDYFFQDNYI